jgi:hypothetical protein
LDKDEVDLTLENSLKENTADTQPSYLGYYVLGVLVVCLITYLGFDMYNSYLTTLNYVDPAVRPLYLPAYAEIREVIPIGLNRTEIISMFGEQNLGSINSPENLLLPTSPMLMHGYWE